MYGQLIVILIAFRCELGVSAINFDVERITEIRLDKTAGLEDTYFGYSLILQTGREPMVIVGAPKYNKTGGAIFGCKISEENQCTKYLISTSTIGSFNGNFLGGAIDGDEEIGKPFVACAPRKVTRQGTGINLNHFLTGSCFYMRNSSNFASKPFEIIPLKHEVPVNSINGTHYYDYAFGQAGIDLAYKKDSPNLLLGGPGIKNWNGAIVVQSLKLFTKHQIVPKRTYPIHEENYDYLGYKVGLGSVEESSFMFAGAPRGADLLGKVKLYNDNILFRDFKGDELGSYFGSSVLSADVNADGSDDLFVGAPTSAGDSYDEGCVYYYKNAQQLSGKLVGIKEGGARFGTNLAFLGDIDLDGFNDIAISAPYEEQGRGVVYIFMGGADGIKTTFGQRLTPSSFLGASRGLTVRGFGMGLSRGADVDGNGHNDVAIGAYKSGLVFVLRTKSVIDFRTEMDSTSTKISSNDTQLLLNLCVFYEFRSRAGHTHNVDFEMSLLLDYRVKGENIRGYNITTAPGERSCKTIDVKIEQAIIDTEPFRFTLKTRALGHVLGEGTKLVEKSIPYAHGCGDDDICQTRLFLSATIKQSAIIWGLTKSINVKLSAKNLGEPAYQCQLLIQKPKNLELREEKKCAVENSTYFCPLARKLTNGRVKETFIDFDIDTIREEEEQFEINFRIECVGENTSDGQEEVALKIKIVVQNSPYIEGKSVPEDYELDKEIDSTDTDIELVHTFTLGNFGPSPVKSNIHLLVPIAKIGNDDVFQLIETGGSLRGVNVPCYYTNETEKFDRSYDALSVVKYPLSRTAVLDCFGVGANCLTLMCEGDYLSKSSESGKYTLKFKTNKNILAKFFQNQELSKDITAFISSAYLYSSNNTRIEGHSTTLILSSRPKTVPLWVYIVSSISGLLLLIILVFVFYKCHFFDRRYRDKMNDERLINQPVEINADLSSPFEDDNTEEMNDP